MITRHGGQSGWESRSGKILVAVLGQVGGLSNPVGISIICHDDPATIVFYRAIQLALDEMLRWRTGSVLPSLWSLTYRIVSVLFSDPHEEGTPPGILHE